MTMPPDLSEVLDEPVEVTEFARYLGRRTFNDSDDEGFAQLAIDSAQQLVAQLLTMPSGEFGALPPQPILKLAVLVAASELWERRNSRGGIVNGGTEGESSYRLSWDAMRAVRPLLSSYTVAI